MLTQSRSLRRNRKWTTEEEEALRKHYSNFANADLPMLSGRSQTAARKKLVEMGLHTPKTCCWRTTEIKILKEYFPTEGLAGCQARLPGRTSGAIESQALKLNLQMQYSPRDRLHIDRLLQAEPTIDSQVIYRIAIAVKAPYGYVYNRAYNLKLLAVTNKRRWSDAENAIVVAHRFDVCKCVNVLKQSGFVRSRVAIERHLTVIKATRIDSDGLSREEIAACFGVGIDVVKRWIARGSLPVSPQNRTGFRGEAMWSIGEIRRFMIENTKLWEPRDLNKAMLTEILTC